MGSMWAGGRRASREWRYCGLAEGKFSGPVPVLVKLQRPPPDIRIILPGLLACSTTSTRRPRRPAVIAHITPAAPAPTTTAPNASAIPSVPPPGRRHAHARLARQPSPPPLHPPLPAPNPPPPTPPPQAPPT